MVNPHVSSVQLPTYIPTIFKPTQCILELGFVSYIFVKGIFVFNRKIISVFFSAPAKLDDLLSRQ